MRKMNSISDFIPIAHFKEIHSTHIPAPAQQSWDALQNFELSESKLTSILFLIRGLKFPAISASKKYDWSFSWFGFFFSGFHPIVIRPPHSFVLWLGLTLPDKKMSYHQKKLFKSIYKKFLQKNKDKFGHRNIVWQINENVDIGWDFQIVPISNHSCNLTTETRVFFRSKRFKQLFLPYWIIIRLFSGVIRLDMLRLIRKNAINFCK